MIDFEFDATRSLVVIRPQSRLQAGDFDTLANAVDPQIEAAGSLAGIIIDAPSFPGWADFAALIRHFRFVRDHQKHVKKVAVVTDSPIGDLAEHLASHFISAQIRHFPGGNVESARQWIAGES